MRQHLFKAAEALRRVLFESSVGGALLACYVYVVYSGWVRWALLGAVAFSQLIRAGRQRRTGLLHRSVIRVDNAIIAVANAWYGYRKHRFPRWHARTLNRKIAQKEAALSRAGATWSYQEWQDATLVAAHPVDDTWMQIDYLARATGITHFDADGNVIDAWVSDRHQDHLIGSLRLRRAEANETMIIDTLVEAGTPVQIRSGSPRTHPGSSYDLMIDAPGGVRLRASQGNPPKIKHHDTGS